MREDRFLIAAWHPLTMGRAHRVRSESQRGFFFVLLLGVLGLGLSMFGATVYGWPVWLAPASAAVTLFSAVVSRHWNNGSKLISDQAIEAYQAFGDGTCYAVHLKILQTRVLTGTDHGVVWFEDGYLYFAGMRTSFGLVPEDVRFQPEWVESEGTELALQLEIQHPYSIGQMHIRLIFVGSDRVDTLLQSDFDRLLSAWRYKHRDHAGGQLPPHWLDPSFPKDRNVVAVEFLGYTFVALFSVYLLIGVAIEAGLLGFVLAVIWYRLNVRTRYVRARLRNQNVPYLRNLDLRRDA